MNAAERLIHRFGLQLQAGGLVSERPLSPEEVATIRPHRKAVLRALTPAPLPLVPMPQDTLAGRIGPAERRMGEAEDWLRVARAKGWNVMEGPSYLRPEIVALLTLEARHTESMGASGLRWAPSPAGGAA